MRKRENIIDNPVYSEILIKINRDRVYAVDFIKKFKHKERSVLARQLQILNKSGYLIENNIKEIKNKKEIKFKGNLKYYTINTKRLLIDFYDTLLIFIKEQKTTQLNLYEDNKLLKSNFLKKYKTITSKKFKEDLIENSIFNDYMVFLLNEIDKFYDNDMRLKNITIKNIFLEIFYWGMVSHFEVFLNINSIRRMKKGNILISDDEILEVKSFSEDKILKFKDEIRFITKYFSAVESMGMGNNLYEDINFNAVDKLEKKYLKD
jgi:hypothetical protein